MKARSQKRTAVMAGLLAAVCIAALISASPVGAADPPIGLGTANSYAVLAGSTVTNTGPSVINGDLGLSPGSAVTGFPPGLVNDFQHIEDVEALQAKIDLVTAYDDAAGRTPATSVATELGGTTLLPGVYTGATLGITGTLTLDAGGDAAAVFIIKTDSTLITATDSAVNLINGANPCNVFWQVSSSATLGTRTAFQGTILAFTSISADMGATVEGRLLARNGAVTLDNNVINRPECADVPPPTTTSTSTSTSTSTTSTTSTTSSSSTSSTTSSTSSTTSSTTSPSSTSPSSTSPSSTSPSSTSPSSTSPSSTSPSSTSTTAPGLSLAGTATSTTAPDLSLTSTAPSTTAPDLSLTSTAPSTTAPGLAFSGGGSTGGGSTGSSGGGFVTSGGPGTPYSSPYLSQETTPLARTGSSILPVAVAGSISFFLGLWMVVAARRRAAGTR
ncbi:MAG: ice-binding family protein [Candidatus Microthrix parvicella]